MTTPDTPPVSPATEPRTEAGRELLAHIERLDYDAYDAGRAFMEEKGGGDWAESILAIEIEAAQGAAPRAEGLDVERLRREFGYLLDMYGARDDESGHWANCRDMLALSRPSDDPEETDGR